MKNKRKICIFTGTRAEYGLLKPLIDELKSIKSIELQLIVTGMHLSPEFGMTYKEIEMKPFSSVEMVEILMSSDTAVGISKSLGLGMISFGERLNILKPDLLIGLGDRFELFAAVSSALVLKIPVAHIHGGEITLGAYDEGFRHAITKMSHIHFTSTEEYRRRVIQLGENPKTVYNVGALGIDNIKKMKLQTKAELEESISFKLDKPYFVVTYHPVTLENNTAEKQMNELLKALNVYKNFKIIFTNPNADNGSKIIIKLIKEYVNKNPDRSIVFDSLGQLRYLSALKHSEMAIGNSSSGIIEMPYFNKPTINIGDRQHGRIFSKSVVQSTPQFKNILEMINKGLNHKFRKDNCKEVNIYGKGTTAQKITQILLRTNYSKLTKKRFYDL